MSAVTHSHKTDFDALGFTLVEDVIPRDQLVALREDLKRLWKRAKNKDIASVRVYEDFPYFLGGVNVAGVEDPFVHTPMLAAWMPSSGLDQILADLTGWRGAELELARVHMNDRFKYQGFWHRDAKVEKANSSVVAVIYFEDEEGFRITPSRNKYSAADLELGDDMQKRHFQGPLQGEHIVTAPAGSVFFMKSYLLHRGYNNKPRLHLHTRFIEAPVTNAAGWAQYRNPVSPYDFGASKPAARLRRLASYCIPRKDRSSLFQA